ncbi:hypothetical protein [Pseudomonas sp. B21-048]|uniref:hypothetical protein n=1 Tax=Pseudomonas sp. B21-048 TaxID=2895490 RepID=UPI00215DFD68|nr:hypothetical protein [Pseudomonas sp. B21-048]UVK98793.1 hypothetical protein LOY56_26480 [Pseudomonas sp. B21-048]
MIYIEENSFARQIQLISEFVNQEPFELVIWLYPESSIDRIIGENICASTIVNAVPVTTYESDGVARCTQRLQLTDMLINKITQEKDFISQNCDSLCIYSPKSPEWQACTIGHEGMILVKDTALLNKLKALGFNASLHAPSWW